MRRAQKRSGLGVSRNPPPTAFFPTRAWTDLSAEIDEQWVPRKTNGSHSGSHPWKLSTELYHTDKLAGN